MGNRKKKVLLLALRDWNLFELIVANLEMSGYDVTLVLNQGYKFSYRNFWQRLQNLYRKIVFNDKSYKVQLRKKFDNEKQLSIIDRQNAFDYCLVFRADLFDPHVLNLAKSKSLEFVSYHYDGLSRNNDIFGVIRLFDRFYVFDNKDVLQYPDLNLFLTTNFYFDNLKFLPKNEEDEKKKLYFLGTYYPGRIDIIMESYEKLNDLGISLKFELFFEDKYSSIRESYKRDSVYFLDQILPYREYLDRVNEAEVLLDFVISEHNGLSFRIFEGLYFKKKVVTTNSSVRDMDFYHEHNYFVLENDNYAELISFLETPYVEISTEISEKYSFSNWFRRIFELDVNKG